MKTAGRRNVGGSKSLLPRLRSEAGTKGRFYLAVNTPQDGKTGEANFPGNTATSNPAVVIWRSGWKKFWLPAIKLQWEISRMQRSGNALMAELSARHLLEKLDAYSGWNTAGNTLVMQSGKE